jgi:hypothetical protein
MKVLEKMARALCGKALRRPVDHPEVDHFWDLQVADARTVLLAIREPDDVVMQAYYELTDEDGNLSGDTCATDAWIAQIDAILKEA